MSLTERPTAFKPLGFKRTIAERVDEIATLYSADQIPWVIGYSGGKDSTATLQLVWMALEQMKPEDRKKPVYVISTDTLVENPVVAAWVARSLAQLSEKAEADGLPITAHRLTPNLKDSFWVNLIGRGYPAPRPKFRWCTQRLKIDPSSNFISTVVRENGEAIVVLGTRKAESNARARSMERLEQKRIRERLSPNKNLPNSYVYTPVEDWTNDDVWMFLMQVPNRWGFNNKDLLTMYQGASADGECPLVIDDTTPSCGDSRFGCWVCTLVDQDKSMQAMIQNDQEKEWMAPLLALRNELDVRNDDNQRDDKHLRDFRRMNGSVQLYQNRIIHGPYRQRVRETWLRKVLAAQAQIRRHGPEEMADFELLSLPELHEIRRIWVQEKHEFEDSLPGIYAELTGETFPGGRLDDTLVLGADELRLLRDICGEDELHFELTRELIDIEHQHRAMMRRAGLQAALEQAIRRGFYDSPEDALERATRRQQGADEPLAEPVELELALDGPLAPEPGA